MMGSAWVSGQLEGLAEGGTSVEGSVGMSADVTLAIQLGIILTVFILIPIMRQSLVGLLVGVGILGIMVIGFQTGVRSARSKLKRSLLQILEANVG